MKRASPKSDRPCLSQPLLLGHTAGVTIRNLNVRAADWPDTALGLEVSDAGESQQRSCFSSLCSHKTIQVGHQREHVPLGVGQIARCSAASP